VNDPQVNGHCDARFGLVADAFEQNFAARGELGAGVAVFVDGERVVDLVGGWKDTHRTVPWGPDTIVCVASVSKAFAATALLMLVQEGRVSLAIPVADVWPEFGKPETTIEHLLTHQAGLPGVTEPLPPAAYMEWDLMTGALARQAPLWTPGTRHGYHPITFGFLVGEVVRRVAGQTIGAFIDAHICGPHRLDFHLGLATERVWDIAEMQPLDFTDRNASPELRALIERSADPDSFWSAATSNPRVPPDIANWPEYRAAEVPAGNGHGSARALAGFYRHLGAGDYLTADALVDATTERAFGLDAVLEVPSRFGLGFMLRHDGFPIGPSPRAFGHPGAGGNLGFYDPEQRVAFGYVMNKGKPSIFGSPTAYALVKAVYASLS
jgi:CubicO group peptidase (beta-lactamase class C family)